MQDAKLMLLKMKIGATYTTLCGINSRSLKITDDKGTAHVYNANAPTGAVWQNTFSGVKSVSISGSGYFDDPVAVKALMTIKVSGTPKAEFQVIVPGLGTFAGLYHIDELEFTGQNEDAVTYATALSSDGLISYTPEA